MVRNEDGSRGHRRPIRLDSMVEVSGGVVGTDPYRRWGPAFRWTVVILELLTGARWRPFNKRDVVVTDLSRTQEFYREGPFRAGAADKRKSTIATDIESDGLDQFLAESRLSSQQSGRCLRRAAE
jgi:hypothetical protein